MKISLQERKNNPAKDKLYNKLASTAYHVKDRVNNPKFKQYHNYGGRGVTMDSKWLTVKGFIDDADSIDGWNEEMFLEGNLELDKDIKFPGNMLYDKEHTKWVTHKENMQVLPEVQKPFYAYNVYTGELIKGISLVKFANEYRLGVDGISASLRKVKHRTQDWYFWYEGDTPHEINRYYYYKGNTNLTIWDINPQRLSLKLGMNRAFISSKLKDPTRVRKGDKLWVKKVNLEELIKPND